MKWIVFISLGMMLGLQSSRTLAQADGMVYTLYRTSPVDASAHPSTADIHQGDDNVRFVPWHEIAAR